jgi:NADP-dependent 3-hydroxy acid dehydrogenase YdfG
MAIDGLCETEYDIACRQIDIGNAATDLVEAVLEDGAGAAQADGSKVTQPTMDRDHVARAIVHMASLPLDVNVLFMTITATKLPFVGHG